MIQAVLSNSNRPNYGEVTMPFAVPDFKYAHRLELLETLGIGSSGECDCFATEIRGACPILKRPDSFDTGVDVPVADPRHYGSGRRSQLGGMHLG